MDNKDRTKAHSLYHTLLCYNTNPYNKKPSEEQKKKLKAGQTKNLKVGDIFIEEVEE